MICKSDVLYDCKMNNGVNALIICQSTLVYDFLVILLHTLRDLIKL